MMHFAAVRFDFWRGRPWAKWFSQKNCAVKVRTVFLAPSFLDQLRVRGLGIQLLMSATRSLGNTPLLRNSLEPWKGSRGPRRGSERRGLPRPLSLAQRLIGNGPNTVSSKLWKARSIHTLWRDLSWQIVSWQAMLSRDDAAIVSLSLYPNGFATIAGHFPYPGQKRAEYGFGEPGFKQGTQWVFWPSPSSGQRTQWVPLSLLFVCQSELTEFFAELTEFAVKLSEAQWVLFSETVLSKQYSARFLDLKYLKISLRASNSSLQYHRKN